MTSGRSDGVPAERERSLRRGPHPVLKREDAHVRNDEVCEGLIFLQETSALDKDILRPLGFHDDRIERASE